MKELTYKYPLTWPEKEPKTPIEARQILRKKRTFLEAYTELCLQVKHARLRKCTLTTNAIINKSLKVEAMYRPNTGVTLYYQGRDRKPRVFYCDKYKTIAQNMMAIAETIEHYRKIDALKVRTGVVEYREQATLF